MSTVDERISLNYEEEEIGVRDSVLRFVQETRDERRIAKDDIGNLVLEPSTLIELILFQETNISLEALNISDLTLVEYTEIFNNVMFNVLTPLEVLEFLIKTKGVQFDISYIMFSTLFLDEPNIVSENDRVQFDFVMSIGDKEIKEKNLSYIWETNPYTFYQLLTLENSTKDVYYPLNEERNINVVIIDEDEYDAIESNKETLVERTDYFESKFRINPKDVSVNVSCPDFSWSNFESIYELLNVIENGIFSDAFLEDLRTDVIINLLTAHNYFGLYTEEINGKLYIPFNGFLSVFIRDNIKSFTDDPDIKNNLQDQINLMLPNDYAKRFLQSII